jgi:hypothetical protein
MNNFNRQNDRELPLSYDPKVPISEQITRETEKIKAFNKIDAERKAAEAAKNLLNTRK